MVTYRCDLDKGKQIYIENQESLTAIALVSGGSNQQQSQRQSFETGKWQVPPTVFLQSSSGVVLRIEAEQGQYFIQVQASGMSRLNTVPSLSDANVLPLHKVDETAASNLPDMQPMKPMKPMPPMQMDDMQMQMTPMKMQMGNMEMHMGEPIEKKMPESRQLTKNFCNQCGSKIEEKDRFCSYCGNRLVPVES